MLHIYPSATDAVWSYNLATSLGSTTIDAAGCLLGVPQVLWKLNFALLHVPKKNEMGGACDTYGGGQRCAQGSGEETWGKETIGETQT